MGLLENLSGFSAIIGGLGILMLLERLFPDQPLKVVPGWWRRVLIVNLFQLGVVIFCMKTLESWVQSHSLFHLGDYVSAPVGGFIAYLVTTWVFYWWHLARHEIYTLWLFFHQVHHSAQRLETITSFYKHPLEIVYDSVLNTLILYPVLGLKMESSIWLSAFCAFGEYFYHMNIQTPHWIGYFFQRPESHRIHHYHNKRHCQNYSDLPLWDMLGGTFYNPPESERAIPTGFETAQEEQLYDMIRFKDVLRPWKTLTAEYNLYNLLGRCLLILGCLQTWGYFYHSPAVRGVGMVTAASPLPLVFSSFNGVETFATNFTLQLSLAERSSGLVRNITLPVTADWYEQLEGPYNLRNAYGAMFSHGPFFHDPAMIKLRQGILKHLFCHSAHTRQWQKDLGVLQAVTIEVRCQTAGKAPERWFVGVHCY